MLPRYLHTQCVCVCVCVCVCMQECDNNAELDDMEAIEQDAQDAYFSDASDDAAPAAPRPCNRYAKLVNYSRHVSQLLSHS